MWAVSELSRPGRYRCHCIVSAGQVHSISREPTFGIQHTSRTRSPQRRCVRKRRRGRGAVRGLGTDLIGAGEASRAEKGADCRGKSAAQAVVGCALGKKHLIDGRGGVDNAEGGLFLLACVSARVDSVRRPSGRSRAACPRAANAVAGDQARRPPPGRPLHPKPGRSTGRRHRKKV